MRAISIIPLYRKKQLKRIEKYKNICSATFDDSRDMFHITFDLGNNQKQDIGLLFGEKKFRPLVFISAIYED
jgi:hypothetical protein